MQCLESLHHPDIPPLWVSVTPKEFGYLQMACDTMIPAHSKTETRVVDEIGNNSTFQFLFLRWTHEMSHFTESRKGVFGRSN